jgi:trimethylamine-N-oxide reductase (cytochrome c)
VEQYYNATDMPKHMTFAEFKQKGYFVVPDNPGRKKTPALRWFAEDREKDTPDWGPRLNNQVGRKGLQTSTGKVEFISTSSRISRTSVDVLPPRTPTCGRGGPSCESPRSTRWACCPHLRFVPHHGDGKDSFMNDIGPPRP